MLQHRGRTGANPKEHCEILIGEGPEIHSFLQLAVLAMYYGYQL